MATTGPLAPSALSATAASNTQINLAWTDNSANELGFKIERCAGATCTNFVHIATRGANLTTYANTGLAANTSYRYRVRSYNAIGNSTYSNIATRATPAGAAGEEVAAAAYSAVLEALVQGDATYATHVDTGELTITTAATGAFTLYQAVACAEEAQPTAVVLLVGEQRLAMQAVAAHNQTYAAVIQAQTLASSSDHLVVVQWSCAGQAEPLENYIGTLQINSAEEAVAFPTNLYLPTVLR